MEHPKYIIFKSNGLEIPVIFPPLLNHNEIKYGFFEPISAGFCCFNLLDKTVNVWGKSISLNLNSRKEDAEILIKCFLPH